MEGFNPVPGQEKTQGDKPNGKGKKSRCHVDKDKKKAFGSNTIRNGVASRKPASARRNFHRNIFMLAFEVSMGLLF